MTSTRIHRLKDNLSRYIRRIEAGERIAITAHGRVVDHKSSQATTGSGKNARALGNAVE